MYQFNLGSHLSKNLKNFIHKRIPFNKKSLKGEKKTLHLLGGWDIFVHWVKGKCEVVEPTKYPSYLRGFQLVGVEDLEDGDKTVWRFWGWDLRVGEIIWWKSVIHVEATEREAKGRENLFTVCIKKALPVNFI